MGDAAKRNGRVRQCVIITDRFVHIHQPKTGGTFVNAALFRVHDIQWDSEHARLYDLEGFTADDTPYGTFIFRAHFHGRCRDIPEPHTRKKILSTVRNPYDWYVSHFRFSWWKSHKRLGYFLRVVPDLHERYPGFPNIDFDAFVDFANRSYPVFPELGFGGSRELTPLLHARDAALKPAADDLGPMTQEFVDFFFIDPHDVLSRLADGHSGLLANEPGMFDVTFLRMERLNRQLHDFLVSEGYAPRDAAVVLGMERVHPHGVGRANDEGWESFYSPALKAFVRHQERHLFSMFPEFDV